MKKLFSRNVLSILFVFIFVVIVPIVIQEILVFSDHIVYVLSYSNFIIVILIYYLLRYRYTYKIKNYISSMNCIHCFNYLIDLNDSFVPYTNYDKLQFREIWDEYIEYVKHLFWSDDCNITFEHPAFHQCTCDDFFSLTFFDFISKNFLDKKYNELFSDDEMLNNLGLFCYKCLYCCSKYGISHDCISYDYTHGLLDNLSKKIKCE